MRNYSRNNIHAAKATLLGIGVSVSSLTMALTCDQTSTPPKTIPDPTSTTCVLNPDALPKFVNDLPLPKRIDATKGGTFKIRMEQTSQDVLGIKMPTTVWGYGLVGQPVTFPGPTVVAKQNVPINIQWQNNLPLTHLLPVDTSLHMATPNTGIPTVVHLHGGHSEAASDGHPEAWFTQNFTEKGQKFVKQTYVYDNPQEAATLFYHDHSLGFTRLNVYAGLAGAYLIRDDNELTNISTNKIPSGSREIELLLQDRMFTPDGQLFFPSAPPVAGAPDPSVLPEFFGNVVLVNGKAWPKLSVQPRKYRFHVVNGSDSRYYHISLQKSDGTLTSFKQIGADQGFLDRNVTLQDLTISPGERAVIVVDFSSLSGQRIIIKNDAREPFPLGAPADPGATQVMAFDVGAKSVVDNVTTIASTYRTSTSSATLTTTALKQVPLNRQLILAEDVDTFGRIMPMLGTVKDGFLHWSEPTTETPKINTAETWEVYNTTVDAHALHLHLVSFQVTQRAPYTALQDTTTGALTNIVLGTPLPIPANEKAPRDVVLVNPGEMVKVRAFFDRPGDYVWHCHMLSHEDHDMMRPQNVVR